MRWLIGMTATALMLANGPAAAQAVEQVVPSEADPGVRQFDDPSLVLNGRATAPLVVFLPGTHGRSETAPMRLLETVAAQGYRVVFLSYDDVPAVSQVCPGRAPVCSARFREERVFGDAPGAAVSNPPAEAIVPRLTALLRVLARRHPDAGWERYLAGDAPAWDRIVVSGLSQGAGMAAYIAKRFPVARAVLFSSPWDQTGIDRRPAPWLFGPSATPPERWWAERHAREATTGLLANAYAALAIPADHLLVFDGPLPPGTNPDAANPYHGSTVRLAQYAPQWRVMFGRP